MMNFGGDMISGKWMNKNTGEEILVRSSCMNGDEMIIQTDKGILSMDIFSRDYIQVSDEVYDINGNVTESKPYNSNEDNKQQTTGFSPETLAILTGKPLNNEKYEDVVKQSSSASTINIETLSSNNYKYIDKVFSKCKSKPNINMLIDWSDFPKTKIEMLQDIFDIEEYEILDYIYQKYFSPDDIKKEISHFLSQM